MDSFFTSALTVLLVLAAVQIAFQVAASRNEAQKRKRAWQQLKVTLLDRREFSGVFVSADLKAATKSVDFDYVRCICESGGFAEIRLTEGGTLTHSRDELSGHVVLAVPGVDSHVKLPFAQIQYLFRND